MRGMPWSALVLAAQVSSAPPSGAPAPAGLAEPPIFGSALGAFAGLGVEATADGTYGQALGGGELVLRVSHAQLVGCASASELSASRARTWCLLGGGLFPFVGWADLDVSLGYARRTFTSEDTRYGPSGYAIGSDAIAARVGLTARAGGWAGVRFGAFLDVHHDLDPQRVPWIYRLSDEVSVSGTTAVGGTTISLAVRLAADLELVSR